MGKVHPPDKVGESGLAAQQVEPTPHDKMPTMRRSAATRILGRLALTTIVAAALYLGLYRPLQLNWGATGEEASRAMPGDAIQPHPIFNATRAITIESPAEKIWPWLVQIGYRRAGWYSGLDWLDNDGIPSAAEIVPALQHLTVGDPLPIWRDITQKVVALDQGRYILTSSLSDTDSWLWMVVPLDESRTRLLWRMRSAPYAWRSPAFLVRQLATDVGDFVVVRNILLGIKERAEGRPIGSLAASTTDVALWLAAFTAFLGALGSLALRPDWLGPLAAVGLTAATTLLLVFEMPPVWLELIAVLVSCWILWRFGVRTRVSSLRPPAAR